jgi:hypothetical protein
VEGGGVVEGGAGFEHGAGERGPDECEADERGVNEFSRCR